MQALFYKLAYQGVTHSRYSIEKRAWLNNRMSFQVKKVLTGHPHLVDVQ